MRAVLCRAEKTAVGGGTSCTPGPADDAPLRSVRSRSARGQAGSPGDLCPWHLYETAWQTGQPPARRLEVSDAR